MFVGEKSAAPSAVLISIVFSITLCGGSTQGGSSASVKLSISRVTSRELNAWPKCMASQLSIVSCIGETTATSKS